MLLSGLKANFYEPYVDKPSGKPGLLAVEPSKYM